MPPLRHLLTLLLLVTAAPALAHVGSKDVFEQIQAGPYPLFVTVRMPVVLPGIAAVEVRATPPSNHQLTAITIAPTLLTGEASLHPPVPDVMQQSPTDPNLYTGSLWIMSSGAWQIHFTVADPIGTYTAAVPIPAGSTTTLRMQRPLGITLALLGTLLILALAATVGAAVREARLQPGLTPDPARRRRGLLASLAALAVLALLAALGNRWWNVEAATYAGDVFRPLTTTATLRGSTLDLHVTPYTAAPERKYHSRANDDFLPDHGHLMHLYAIRWPAMDAAFHLHPALAAPGDFRLTLPSMPPGAYRLFGDVVHSNGFPETLTATLTIPADVPPAPLDPEDASAFPPPLDWVKAPQSAALLPVTPVAVRGGPLGPDYKLPDGYTMHWDRSADLTANTATLFRFTLLDPTGHPATDIEPYLGMAGHAAFVKWDGSVFAHTHPEGSAPMPSMMLANPMLANPMLANPASMPDMQAPASTNDPHRTGPLSPTVTFPYGLPTPGRYRIFVQMKHAGTVETGVFDTEVH